VWIDKTLNVAPADASLYANRRRVRLEPEHTVHLAHIQMQGARTRGMPSHAEMAAAYRYRQIGLGKRLDDFLRGGGRSD
jgi:hypothetical protein